MLHSKGKNHVFSDGFISPILVGWAHVLDVVWVVSSDGENIGRVAYLRYGLLTVRNVPNIFRIPLEVSDHLKNFVEKTPKLSFGTNQNESFSEANNTESKQTTASQCKYSLQRSEIRTFLDGRIR